eukprot:TRINITY_DN12982_c0_g1_i1.p1 TRINITY_DN12982_c0_g1~~TRINITY_DN12982_c0_g1_i1.p1  ORF type:complete len:1317 (-),score=261.77 TRINITY_DN12982_c0_g1_i1:100-3759(-)
MRIFSYSSCGTRALLILGTIFAYLQGALVPTIALLTSESVTVLTSAQPDRVLSGMAPVLMKIAALAGAQFLLTFGWQLCLYAGGTAQGVDINMAYIRTLLQNNVAWFDEREPVGIATRMQTDIAYLRYFVGTGSGYFSAAVAQFIAGLVLAFISSWQLSLVVCAALPVLIVTGGYLGRQTEKALSGQQEDFGRASSVAEEALAAIRTVAACGTEVQEQKRFEKELTAAKYGGIKAGFKLGIAWGFMNMWFSLVYALAFWYGGTYLVAGPNHYSGGHVVTVLIALVMSVSGLTTFSGYMAAFMRAIASAKSLLEVLENPDHDIEVSEEDLPAEAATMQSIEFRSVSFRYPNRPENLVLNKLSFQILRGQKVAFVGETAAGKTTTIQLLERFYDPDAGEVLVNGLPLARLPAKAWRRQVGYVGQEPVLFAESALSNIKAGNPDISDEMAVEAARNAQIYDFLQEQPDKMDTFVGAGGGQLSGGQKQRLAIARALARKPQILLLDEATAALDNEAERMVQATLEGLEQRLGRSVTTISVAHRLTTIMNSDRIFVLQRGHCCEQGTHNELLQRRGEYFRIACGQQATGTGQEGEADEQLANGEAGTSRPPLPQMASSSSLLDTMVTLDFRTYSAKQAGQHVAGPVVPRLLRLLDRKERWIFPIALLSVLLAAICVPLQAIFFNVAIFSLFIPQVDAMLQAIDRASLILAVLGAFQLLSEIGKYGAFSYIQECLTLKLRKMAFHSIICREMSFFDAKENQTGSLIYAMERHVARVSLMLGQNAANSTAAILTCIASLAFSFYGAWKFALALVGFMLLSAVLSICSATWASKPSLEGDTCLATATKTIHEAVTQIRTVHALGAEAYTLETIFENFDVLYRIEKVRAVKIATSLGFNFCLIECVMLAGYWVSGVLVAKQSYKADQVLLTLFCVIFGLLQSSQLAAYLPDAATGAVAAAETFRLVDQESKIDATKTQPDSNFQTLGDGSICFENVRFRYPHRPEVKILDRLNLTVLKGQAVALVGFSGSGKSTVIQLLQRFYDPQGGSIKIGGVNLKFFDVAWWRQQLGVVGQEPVLFDISLEDNIRYGRPDASHDEVLEVARAANMDYALSGQVSWSTCLGLRGGSLSGGQKQRCAIARALLRRPQILLLDEATSALDSAMERIIQQALQTYRAGKTTITVAHRLSTIRDSHQIFVMAAGRVKERGTFDELLAAGGAFATLAAKNV